jgi:signal transduction histidine kinase
VIARRVIFEGRVQGVGFRYTTKDIAKGFDVCGTVKNLPEGTVELEVMGERDELVQVFENLIENACKWARRRVRISAGATGMGQMVVVVEDDGPGLPAEQREAALERGARLDETTPGSGLGLSIVVELTRAYGGRVTLADSDMGGLKVLLELPAAEA